MENTIACPECGAEIELTEALTASIRQKYDQDAKQKEEGFNKRKKALDKREGGIDRKIAEKLENERLRIVEDERSKLQAEQTTQLEAKELELLTLRGKLHVANENELDLRKQRQEMADMKDALDLTIQRKLDEERKVIREQASQAAMEQEQLKLREKDDLLNVMKTQIEDLKRRIEVGSQQGQGEALELQLEETLRQAFFSDKFEEVKKGQRGADIVQKVHNNSGKYCGTILIESKNTKNFDNAWISKLRKDQQIAKAEIAVLVTVVLPKGFNTFGLQDGDIWVSNIVSILGLITALRQTLIEVTRQKLVSAGKETITGMVYDYVTGPEFAMHLKTVSSAFIIMQSELEKEKRALTLIWKKREQQINSVLTNITGMSGSIEGISQKALPVSASLEEIR